VSNTDMLGNEVIAGCKIVYPLVRGSNTYLGYAEVLEVLSVPDRKMWDGHETAEDKRYHIKAKLLDYSDPHQVYSREKDRIFHLQKPERVVIVG
jgi:hypothetical protein